MQVERRRCWRGNLDMVVRVVLRDGDVTKDGEATVVEMLVLVQILVFHEVYFAPAEGRPLEGALRYVFGAGWHPVPVEYAQLALCRGSAGLFVARLLEEDGDVALVQIGATVWIACKTPVVAADVERA
jgi:hypothetical protein